MAHFVQVGADFINLDGVRAIGFERLDGKPALRIGFPDGYVWVLLNTAAADRLLDVLVPDVSHADLFREHFGEEQPAEDLGPGQLLIKPISVDFDEAGRAALAEKLGQFRFSGRMTNQR